MVSGGEGPVVVVTAAKDEAFVHVDTVPSHPIRVVSMRRSDGWSGSPTPVNSGTRLTTAAPAILRWPVAIVVSATAAAFIYRRRRALEGYRVDIRQGRRWKSLGLSPEEARDHQDLGPEFVSRWLAAGFTVAEMDELIRHKIFLDEAVAWRRAGVSVDVASEWGRYRLSPDDVHVWAAHGFRANAAYVCKSAGLTPQEATIAYERGEHPAFVAARKKQGAHATLHAPAGWSGPYPPQDAPPIALLSWDDDEDGPKVEWWLAR